MTNVYVFDFDGVLAIPYSVPEKHYDQVPSLIKQLYDQGNILCMASFNPDSIESIERWGLMKYFTAVRGGCNFKWSGIKSEYKDEIHRNQLLKSTQIISMMNEELSSLVPRVEHLRFFDDDKLNILQFEKAFSSDKRFKSVLVDFKQGLLEKHL